MYAILCTLAHILMESPEPKCLSYTDLGTSVQQPQRYLAIQFRVHLISS